MIAGARFALWQKRAGVLAMVLLVGALASLVDALIGGLGGTRGLIELIPDSRYAISGPMPARTEFIKDFIIEGEPVDGSVRLVPEKVFTGYWLGGSMWRGHIVVDPFAREGQHVITVKDRSGEKQNPTLVFTVKVWPDEASLNAHSPSFLTRKTGRNPYFFVIALVICGGLAAGANFILGRLWARHLAVHHCGEIFKLRRTHLGTEITFEFHGSGLLRPGMRGDIYRSSGQHLSTATISRFDHGEVVMLVNEPEHVRLGDVACISFAGDEIAAG